MKKLISFLLSVTLCGSMLTIFPAASWDLDEQEVVEGDISSYVQVEEVTFGEPEPLTETLNEEDLYQLEMVGDFFEVEANSQEEQSAVQPMADLPDLSVRNLRINSGDITSPYPAGMAMYYTFQLLNYGTADAEDAEIIVKLDGEVATNPVPMGTVPAGMGGNIQFRGPEMTPGTHTMEIVVNPDNKIVESNYDNNTTSSTFTYEACFELVAVEITSNKQGGESSVPTYKLGESVTFTMTFQNSGLLAVENVPIALFGTFRAPGEQPVTSQMGYTNYIAEMPAKTKMSAVVKLNFTREASARISFTLDPEEILGDMDYSNNTAETNLKIIPATYALCIGVNKDSDPESGHFAATVQQVHQIFTDAGIDSTYSASPNCDFLVSKNSYSNRNQLASDVLFFYGHGNEKCIAFWSNNNHTGVFAVDSKYVGTTNEETGEQTTFAGIMDEDFQYVKVANFIGCKTADQSEGGNDTRSIAQFANEQGAKASLGFHGEVYGETNDSKKWIVNYAENLADGYGAEESKNIASANFPEADLAKKAEVFGEKNYSLLNTSAMAREAGNNSIEGLMMSDPNNLLSSPIKIQELSDAYILEEKASDHSEYQEIYNIIQSLDSEFKPEEYLLSINLNDSDQCTMMLQYCIEDTIMTSKYITVFYKEGTIYFIGESGQQVEMLSDTNALEEDLLKRVEEYQNQPQAYSVKEFDLEDGVTVTPTEKRFYYDYETGELKELRRYVFTYPDQTQYGYEEEILIP